MITHNLGFPRIGAFRELKKVTEAYWAGKNSLNEVLNCGKKIRYDNWILQKQAGLDLIPSNDFSFYDHVLDLTYMVNAVPERYHQLALKKDISEQDLYFAMARGYQKDGLDIIAMEMTKWFDTNYHYIVPEFKKNQKFSLISNKTVAEFCEAKQHGLVTKPVILGPVSYLLLGKEKETGFDKIDLISNLLPVYFNILEKLQEQGAQWIQFDEPFLVTDLSEKVKKVYEEVYTAIKKSFPYLKIILATYFDCMGKNLGQVFKLPVDTLHIDLVRCPSQLEDILQSKFPESSSALSLGIVDGRNIWKNNFQNSLSLIHKAIEKLGPERIWLAPSCSLLHCPVNLENEKKIPEQIKKWLAFAKQKTEEVVTLKKLSGIEAPGQMEYALRENNTAIEDRRNSDLIHKRHIKEKLQGLNPEDFNRKNKFSDRQQVQKKKLKLPLFPTTTIGSFPQTNAIRSLRAKFKKQEILLEEYEQEIKAEISRCIKKQDLIGLDVLVHGEFERNDMVEYFGELLEGFLFTENGWVQSYGSRCVKPPIIYGDIDRKEAMTVKWTRFAQSCTSKPVKGMLTGPVTILQWSFVRDDQKRSETAFQLALAIREEVKDLEEAGIKIIQIDEPAIREGMPLQEKDRQEYFDWAVKAFRLSASAVKDDTQIHTHMCYSDFNDIISEIAALDADVITIETSRSQMELLTAFANFSYPNEIGPGVYDIHSPRIPEKEEMESLLIKALNYIPAENLWVNPDCGLKTRNWDETEKALIKMVYAAQNLREQITISY